MAKTRIYEVQAEPELIDITRTGDQFRRFTAGSYHKTFLVEASSRSAAKQAIAKRYLGPVTLPSGKRIADLMGVGVKVEEAAGE